MALITICCYDLSQNTIQGGIGTVFNVNTILYTYSTYMYNNVLFHTNNSLQRDVAKSAKFGMNWSDWYRENWLNLGPAQKALIRSRFLPLFIFNVEFKFSALLYSQPSPLYMQYRSRGPGGTKHDLYAVHIILQVAYKSILQ